MKDDSKKEKPVRKKASVKKETKSSAKASNVDAKKPALLGEIKLFNRWSSSDIQMRDMGLRNYINVDSKILPRSAGVYRERFHKSKRHIVERLALDLMVSGHSGKKHRLTSGVFGGSFDNALKTVEKAMDIIEKTEKVNPIQVLVTGIENAAVREEIISFQVGSIVAREAVITAPQRRIDKTLRFFAQGSHKKAFNKKKSLAEALAEELINAYKNSNLSTAVSEKERIEREATGAR